MSALFKKEYYPDDPTTLTSHTYDTYDGAEPGGERPMDPETAKAAADIIIGKVENRLRDIVREETDKANKAWDASPRVVTIGGQVMPLGTPRGSRMGGGQAPAHVRAGSLGSGTYSLAKVMRAVAERNLALAPLEHDLSLKLERLGYHSSAGGWQIPLGWDLTSQPGMEDEAEALDTEIKGLFPHVAVDPERLAWMRTKMGAKAMDRLDETAGGSTIAFPTLGPLIDLLRPATAVLRAGAYEVPLPPQGAASFPRLKSDATFTWGLACHEGVARVQRLGLSLLKVSVPCPCGGSAEVLIKQG